VRDELGIDPSTWPEIRTDVRYTLCSRCLETSSCEMHHIAPQSVFEDADDWPRVPLCQQCHDNFTSGFEAYVQRRIAQAVARIRRVS
jgi:5-methylcytosine-specific restriction endonuclease McrA